MRYKNNIGTSAQEALRARLVAVHFRRENGRLTLYPPFVSAVKPLKTKIQRGSRSQNVIRYGLFARRVRSARVVVSPG
jgi:hypothetical protein